MIIHREETVWGKTAIIALSDGLAIAMVSVLNSDPSFAVVHDLVVHKTARKKGLGNALLDMAEREAEHMEAGYIRATVEAGAWQIDWYKRHGYEEIWTGDFEGFPCIILEKEIRRETEEPQAILSV